MFYCNVLTLKMNNLGFPPVSLKKNESVKSFFSAFIQVFHSAREYARASGKVREIRDFLEEVRENSVKKIFIHAIF